MNIRIQRLIAGFIGGIEGLGALVQIFGEDSYGASIIANDYVTEFRKEEFEEMARPVSAILPPDTESHRLFTTGFNYVKSLYETRDKELGRVA